MRLLTALLLLVVTALPAAALDLEGTCQVRFHGTSTLHDFDGRGECTPFVLSLGGDGRLQPAEIRVAIAGMTTDNDSRDGQMRKMFDSASYPDILGRFAGGDLAELRGRVAAALESRETIPLQLTIRDVEQPVPATVTQVLDSDKTYSVDLSFPVSLQSYKLKAPSVLGLVRVGDEVRVAISLHLPPLPPAGAGKP